MSQGEAAGLGAPAETQPRAEPAAETAHLRPFALLGSELGTLFRRRRTIAMLVALAAVPVLIAIVVRITHAGSGGRGPAFLGSITDNGLFVGFTALVVCIPLFLPLTLGVVAGDTIAGEAGLGTLRYLLVAPAGRIRLLVVKYAGVVVFSLAATVVIVLAGIGIGALLFPIGPVTLLSGDTVDAGGFFVRTALMAGYVTISLLGLGAIGLFISTLTTVPVGAMAATVVLAGVSQILDQLPQLDWLHPWLFTHYWLGFGDLLRDPIVWDSYGQNAVLQLGYIVVFGCLAYGRFATKDILS
ncbi:ABC transporter permease [Humibacter sp.]|uniref:ABC transporter permease n=1 Tax=Humibacter sp. TaxID=1940291 RepID=UPI003F801FD6